MSDAPVADPRPPSDRTVAGAVQGRETVLDLCGERTGALRAPKGASCDSLRDAVRRSPRTLPGAAASSSTGPARDARIGRTTARSFVFTAWRITIFPGLAPLSVALGVSRLADGLADRMGVTG